MDRYDWSSMYESFVESGITASTVFDISNEKLLEMKMPQPDVIKYQTTKEANKMKGKHTNIQYLISAIYYLILIFCVLLSFAQHTYHNSTNTCSRSPI